MSPSCKSVLSSLFDGSLSDLITLGVPEVRLFTDVWADAAALFIVSKVACNVL